MNIRVSIKNRYLVVKIGIYVLLLYNNKAATTAVYSMRHETFMCIRDASSL